LVLNLIFVKEKYMLDKKIKNFAWYLGESYGEYIFINPEKNIYLIGPQRSGKGINVLIPSIIEAPGAVVSVSTKIDNMEKTIYSRAKNKAPVYLLDIENVSKRQSTFRWNPILGCEDPSIAQARALTLVSATGMSGENAIWATTAASIIGALFHAAAIGNKTIHDLHYWASSPSAAKEAMNILKSAKEASKTTQDWYQILEELESDDPHLLGNKYFAVTESFRPLDVKERRELFNVSKKNATNIEDVLLKGGTLYMVSKQRNSAGSEMSASVGGFFALILDEIVDIARKLSFILPGRRLDPPLQLNLDELASVYPWKRLIATVSDGTGVGINTIAVFQTRSQARSAYGEEDEATLWANCSRIILPGNVNNKDATEIQGLLPSIKKMQISNTYSNSIFNTRYTPQKSINQVDIPLLSLSEISGIPKNIGILLDTNMPPILVNLKQYMDREYAHEIDASLNRHNKYTIKDKNDPFERLPFFVNNKNKLLKKLTAKVRKINFEPQSTKDRKINL
jgi:type IV secretory pathway TraG/TraD family ATPase VirD4